MPLTEIQDKLRRIEQATGVKPALIYAVFVPNSTRQLRQSGTPQNSPQTAPQTESKTKDLAATTAPICRMAQASATNANLPMEQDGDELELYLVTSSGQLVRKTVFGTNRAQILPRVKAFRQEIAS